MLCLVKAPKNSGYLRAAAKATAAGKCCAERLARFEAEVADGKRDARSLVAIPADLAKRASVAFPKDAFGQPQDW